MWPKNKKGMMGEKRLEPKWLRVISDVLVEATPLIHSVASFNRVTA
jgi:hypothetical protein